MRDDWPLDYSGLSFENSSPINCVLLRAVYSAMIERRHAAWSDAGTDTFKDLPHLFGTLSYDFYRNIRDTIFRISPKFIDMDYDYAENEWLDFPRMHSAQTLQSDPACAIAELPFRYGQALAVRGWLQRAKNCLEKLYATVPPFEVWNYILSNAFTFSPDDMNQAVSDANDNFEIYTNRKNVAKAETSFYCFWNFSVTRQGAGSDYNNFIYNASTFQNFNVFLKHRSPFSVIPSVVACRNNYWYEEKNKESWNVFDPVGSDLLLGVNQLSMISGYGILHLNTSQTIGNVTNTPNIEPLEFNPYTNARCCGYRAKMFVDWRCEGGFKFYNKEEE